MRIRLSWAHESTDVMYMYYISKDYMKVELFVPFNH